ncbi:hypothetical protein B0A52_02465 [Exophiala mesophila]|uniref:Large ribosomal subunit protein bL33m n=2 Tax=Exophiala mesophila TaxID=212818 RepID=A0A438NCS1_EXOME|nr:hypothetical protein B0A52_02465 [Exophiala mesophila]
MAKKQKSRTIAVRLLSMAMTGYYRTLIRPRTSRPLSMLKYDPVVKRQVLFLEQKRGGRLNGKSVEKKNEVHAKPVHVRKQMDDVVGHTLTINHN